LHIEVKIHYNFLFVQLACQPASQQRFSLAPNKHQSPATSQPTILFSYNKSVPAISHSQPNRAICRRVEFFFGTGCDAQVKTTCAD